MSFSKRARTELSLSCVNRITQNVLVESSMSSDQQQRRSDVHTQSIERYWLATECRCLDAVRYYAVARKVSILAFKIHRLTEILKRAKIW